MDNKAQIVLERFQKMEGEKATYLSLWQEIGEFCYPSQQDFTRYLSAGNKRRRIIFDNTAERALDTFASSMVGLLANPATKWLNFQHQDPKINDQRDVQLFIDEAQHKVLSVFNNPRVKFYENFYNAIKMMGAFGIAPLMIDKDEETIVKFRSESPKGYNFTEDFAGNIKEHFFEKEFKLSDLQEKGWDIPQEYDKKDKDTKVTVLRHIFSNPDANEERAYGGDIVNKKFFAFKGVYYMKAEKRVLHEDYFETMPIAVARWDKIAGEKWRDSPARVALGDAKVVNAYERSAMVAIEKQINPPLVISSEAKFGKLDTSAGGVNVARGNIAGSYDLMQTNGNLSTPFQWAELKKQQIRSAFYVDVFQSAETPDMTATEAQIRQQEKLRGLGPKAARIQADLLDPVVSRVLFSLIAAGELEVPQSLQEVGIKLDFAYLSPIAQAQRAIEATSILQYIQDMSIVAQIDPSIIDVIDSDMIAKEMAQIRGVPEKVLKSEEDVIALREARVQQAETQNALNSLQQGAETAKTVNEAQQTQQ